MIQVLAQRLVAGWLGKLIIGGFAVLTSVRYGTGIYVWRETEKLEQPSYTVIQKLSDGVELRRYEPYLIAETTVDGVGFREPTGEGFRTCAGYIFGKNKRGKGGDGEKMAMTAPVRVEGSAPAGEKMAMTAPVRVNGGKKKTKVSFVIGSKYSLKTVPKPMENNIKLRQVPAHTLAVRTFSGPPPKDDRVKRERVKLETALLQANLTPKNEETLVYGYHDPLVTPNFLRRNEVAVLIEGSGV
jgi:hypothetical protein